MNEDQTASSNQSNTLLTTLLESVNHKEERFERGDFLIREGERVQQFYLVKTGLVHAFYVSEHEEFTIRFGYKGSLITSIPAFYSGGKSELYLQALRKTVVVHVDRSSFYSAIQNNSTLEQWYTSTLEDLAAQQMERELDLLTTSPSERLSRVLKSSPQLFQEVPMKYIASYLRMTPETLSRIMPR